MKTLTLVRHAKSSWGDEGLPDFERPLNDRGRRDAPEMGRRLKARALPLDALVSSPARRARSTARKLARALGFPASDLREEAAVYDADLAALLGVVHAFDPRWHHVLLVGHNPGLVELAHYFLGRGGFGLPTCAVVALSFDAAAWGDLGEASATALFYDRPKKGGPESCPPFLAPAPREE